MEARADANHMQEISGGGEGGLGAFWSEAHQGRVEGGLDVRDGLSISTFVSLAPLAVRPTLMETCMAISPPFTYTCERSPEGHCGEGNASVTYRTPAFKARALQLKSAPGFLIGRCYLKLLGSPLLFPIFWLDKTSPKHHLGGQGHNHRASCPKIHVRIF